MALHVSRPFAPTTAIAGAGVYGKHENTKLITATTQQHMYDNWDADKCKSGGYDVPITHRKKEQRVAILGHYTE